jgi:hypothetical protein
MDAIRSASEHAVDSNTGQRLSRAETEKYCQEMARIHAKLCTTLIKMFKTRRGLELSVMRLQESEVEGEGLQMLEFEQLRAENQTLKDKLGDRMKDVDNIKDKISHAIQILAHFRVKMFHTTVSVIFSNFTKQSIQLMKLISFNFCDFSSKQSKTNRRS